MIKITPKFDYKEITRSSVNGLRFYNIPDGKPVPSVTTVLSNTQDDGKRLGLEKWRRRVGKAEAERITNEAGNVGTIMHDRLECWIKGIEFTGQKLLQPKLMADTVKINIEPNIDEVWASEAALYFPNLYAGTTDLVGIYKGNPAIMDYKQTNKPKKLEWVEDYLIQLAAYAMAHNSMFGTDIKQGHVFMCSRACQYQQFDLWPDQFDEYAMKWANKVKKFYDRTIQKKLLNDRLNEQINEQNQDQDYS